MSSVYSGNITGGGKKSAVEAESRLDKTLKWLILICVIVLGGELVWLFLVTPCLPLSHIEVTGIAGLEREDILARAGIDGNSSYMTVNTRRIERVLATLPEVFQVHAVKHYPDMLAITLTPRSPTAVSLVVIDGRPCPIYVDHEGIVFRIGGEPIGASIHSLPLISGIVPENVVPGTRLSPVFVSFLANIEHLRSSAPELLSAISEIQVNRNLYDGFDLILYPEYNPVRVRVGAELREDTLKYMLLLLSVLAMEGIEVEELDFRTGTASYVLKEAFSG
jgi:cell division protein FtsQ